METLSALLALCEVNLLVIGEFPSQSLWRGGLLFPWYASEQMVEYNRDAGDLRCYRAHYDVTVVYSVGYTAYVI